MRAYVNRFAVRPGNSAVLFVNNDGGYDAAADLARAGQALYDALYLPLTPAAQREAHGAVLHAAREAALLQHWRGLRPD